MSTERKTRILAFCAVCIAMASSICLPQSVNAQDYTSPDRAIKVSRVYTKLTMMASETRVLTLDHDVPHMVVGNEEIVRATPISPNQVLVTAVKPGVAAISLSDEDNNSKTVDIHVVGDVRQLQAHIDTLFPNTAVKAHAINTSVILTGHVNREAEVLKVLEVARVFSPEVINHLSVGGAQKIALQCKVVEVSRTKLRKFGIDWTAVTSDFNLVNQVSGVATGAPNLQFNILDGNNQFNLFVEMLEQNNLAKILAEPTVVTRSGRAASFLAGGEVPVAIPQGLGLTTVEFQPFGTRLDFVPIALGGGKIQLEVRPEVREIAGDLRDPITGAPGFRTRRVDTGVEMRVGQTLALAGLIQNRVDSNVKGTPILKDMPWIGAAFRRTEETINEVELIVLITPYFINEVDGSMLPTMPGRGTSNPSSSEFYLDGHIEVPTCNDPYELPRIAPQNPGFGSAPAMRQQMVPATQYPVNQQGTQGTTSTNRYPGNSDTVAPANEPAKVSQGNGYRKALNEIYGDEGPRR